MYLRQLCIVLLLLLATSVVAQDDILQLINSGQVAKARRLLSLAPSSDSHDPQWLFYQGLVETDANRAAQMLRASLDASAPAKFRDEIYLRLGQYYAVTGQTEILRKLIDEYRAKLDKGPSRAVMHRLAVLAAEAAGDTTSAVEQCNLFLTRYAKNEIGQWGMIDKYRLLGSASSEDRINLLKNLVAEPTGEAVPIGQFALTLERLESGNVDAAFRQFELLRERFPYAVGLEYIEERFRAVNSTLDDQNISPEVPVRWSIKAGVFSIEANARELARRIDQAGIRAEIGTKVISGKAHYVVYCGQYDSVESAETARIKLIPRFGESLQVVAR